MQQLKQKIGNNVIYKTTKKKWRPEKNCSNCPKKGRGGVRSALLKPSIKMLKLI